MAREKNIIETGVDKLVVLVNEKKKVSVPEAAKVFGVSESVIQEWADFLEEEGIISIEYKFTTTYLVERKLSKNDVEKKAKEFSSKKEGFVRKVESSMSAIDRDSLIITKLHDEFNKIQSQIGDDIVHVKTELDQLSKYEDLKNDLDRQMAEQESEFKKKIAQLEKDISKEENRYNDLINDLEIEKKEIQIEQEKARSLHDQEKHLQDRLKEIEDAIGGLRDKLKSEDKMIYVSEDHIEKIESFSNKILERINEKKSLIKRVVDDSKEYEQKVLKLQDDIAKKVEAKRKEIADDVAHGNKVKHHFDDFHKKIKEMNDVINALENQKKALRDELDTLINKAKGFNLLSKNADVKKHVQQLEAQFEKFEEKKKNFNNMITKLKGFFSDK